MILGGMLTRIHHEIRIRRPQSLANGNRALLSVQLKALVQAVESYREKVECFFASIPAARLVKLSVQIAEEGELIGSIDTRSSVG